jgi:D-glycero-D-manno-heptose 1,7-bisphosphate phosphatase
MSRFSVETSFENPAQSQPGQFNPNDWPTNFPKETIGIERNGIIISNQSTPQNIEEIQLVPDACEAIRTMRLKGYKVAIFFNEPLISEKKITANEVDSSIQHLMQLFGQNGIFSIDGLYYSTTSMKMDMYSLPNNGMLKKAEKENNLKFKGGYFVGDKLYDLKAGFSCGAKPILIKTGLYEETEKKLKSFANRELNSKVKQFNSLLDFAISLP